MKIIYSLPDDSETQPLRANALLLALEQRGHDIVFVDTQEASDKGIAGRLYQTLVGKWLPSRIASRLTETERVTHSREYSQRLIQMIHNTHAQLIFETYTPFSLAAKLASESTEVPYLLDNVLPSWEKQEGDRAALNVKLMEVHHTMTRNAKLMIAINQVTRANLLNEALPEDRLMVLENGIDGKAFHPGVNGTGQRHQLSLPDEAIVFVYVGTFKPSQRLDLLLHAFAQLPTDYQPYLLLVGSGETHEQITALATTLHIAERVHLIGEIPFTEVPPYIAAGDIAVLPGSDPYGNPMTIYEYMGIGCAIIAPDQATITEILTHNENGFLFEHEDVASLTTAMHTLATDQALRQRLGKKAAEDAIQHTWSKRAETLEAAITTSRMEEETPTVEPQKVVESGNSKPNVLP